MEYTYNIIDSNATSKLQLQLYLEEYEDLTCTGVATSAAEGLDSILKHTPDLVLVNLGEDGMEYFQMVTELNQYMQTLPIIIGYSTTKKYAYNAIKSGFFDYWILPHNEFDVRKTILRLRKKHPKDDIPSTICLKSYNDYRYLDTKNILYLKSDNNTTDFYMRDGNVISAFKTLKSFEDKLPEGFIRIHQSYILNSRYVSRINYGKSICTLSHDREEELPFSKTYKDKIDTLKEMLSKTAVKALN
ncbi:MULTISPECIES: LytR/AlgR family response regulator transcription factor [Flagellimonas]|uniref:DNA-binding response regulator n=2 Tax=Flagellimonas TaxID=444459 RepID=A0A3A1NEV7_9FLAO|nr:MULTISPECIES: LytTR family DNA-binding domain-containing protein [Allomuricauda]RIV41997.1 DNA-binding response regulator [Allomuricauda maritima]RIV68525.1 DNA-binding response regulator [Allomuricauda aequoris]TXJ90876.1 response regulator transcription factor [Allomuricauda maritima]TXK00222.1 response regulator transcription factor [Allomuricauda aequoris]